MAVRTLSSLGNSVDFHCAIDIRVARSREELEQAYSLVHREYCKKGYLHDHPVGMRYSLYNSLPQATTFIALFGNKVVATATVLADSPLGLPMDQIYKDELNQLRKEGNGICEVTMLARDCDVLEHIHPKSSYSNLFFMFSFFKTLFDFSRDYLLQRFMCIAIHPKYREVFKHLLFLDLGGLKSYCSVNGAPALARYLDMYSVEEKFSAPGKERLYKIFVERKTDIERFRNKVIFSDQELRYFFMEKMDIFRSAPPAHLAYLKSCYPSCGCFDQ